MYETIFRICQILAGAFMVILGIKFITREQKNIFTRHMSKQALNATIILTVLAFLVGCFLPDHAVVVLPFFVIQSANDIKEKMVSVRLNIILLIYSVLIFVFSTPLKLVVPYVVTAAVILAFSYIFKFYGSGDAKTMTATLLLTATCKFKQDLLNFLFFLLVSYALAFVFVTTKNVIRKRKKQTKEKNIYLYPFLFAGYITIFIF